MKKWFKSKTIWVNVIAIIIFAIEKFAGIGYIDIETMSFILGILNLILRLITKEAISNVEV